jgi:hypothetical protein
VVDMQLLKAKLKYHRRTYSEVAAQIGMNRDTFARRLSTGGKDFRIGEVLTMMEFVPLTYEEMKQIFFTK